MIYHLTTVVLHISVAILGKTVHEVGYHIYSIFCIAFSGMRLITTHYLCLSFNKQACIDEYMKSETNSDQSYITPICNAK